MKQLHRKTQQQFLCVILVSTKHIQQLMHINGAYTTLKIEIKAIYYKFPRQPFTEYTSAVTDSADFNCAKTVPIIITV